MLIPATVYLNPFQLMLVGYSYRKSGSPIVCILIQVGNAFRRIMKSQTLPA